MSKKKPKKTPDFVKKLKDWGANQRPKFKLPLVCEMLGYANRSTIYQKINGDRPWTVEDAMGIERITSGAIKKEEVMPDYPWPESMGSA